MQKFIEPQMVKIIHPKPEKTMTIEMVHLPKGEFMFGDGSDAREVNIDYEFEMGKYQVTFEEYDMYCEDVNVRKPNVKKVWGRGKGPIINVSWYDAVAFCEWLSGRSGQNYRLPTEVEWEYACRAGTTTTWSFGDDEKELDKYAWSANDRTEDAENYCTHVVGEKEPNFWNLYDMHGNVFEWCEDWYDYEEKEKVLRGGSWVNDLRFTTSFYRFRHFPIADINGIGFRLLRTLP